MGQQETNGSQFQFQFGFTFQRQFSVSNCDFKLSSSQ